MALSTPFFKAFEPLLFGKRSKRPLESIKSIDTLGELYEIFGDLIPQQLLENEKQAEDGVRRRERLLTARVTFWAFVWQVLNPGSPCREVVRKVEAWWRWLEWKSKDKKEKAVSDVAYCKARLRLGLDTLHLVFDQLAWNLQRNVLTQEQWLGRRVKIVDGTTLSMPDTPSNQACWPQSTSQKAGLGFPLMKLVGLFSLGSGGLLQVATGNQHEHESQLFRSMWRKLERRDIILGDRAFCSFAAIASLLQREVDSVFRLHQARKADFRSGKKLGGDDKLEVWQKPSICPTGFTKEEFDALPETLTVRLIRLIVSTPGFRTRTVLLVTTLIDTNKYPAQKLRELYGERWNVELHFYQIKITMALDVLRCKSPEMIEREVLIHMIAYNLIRCIMQRSAHLHHVALTRISLKGTLDTTRHFAALIHTASGKPRKQEELIAQMLAIIADDLVPERPDRSEPRAKKRRPKNYHLLTKARKKMRIDQHRSKWRAKVPKCPQPA